MSYEIAATGLNTANEQLSGVSNNVANAGTVGHKSVTTQPLAMYAGSQVMGVSVAGTAQNISRDGSLVSTGNMLDLAISDDGFFVTCDSAGNISYTRIGSLETDKNGYTVNASSTYLRGYLVDDTGTLQTSTAIDIRIRTGNASAQASSSLASTTNFDASNGAIDHTTVSFDATNSSSYTNNYITTVYGSLGNKHSACQYFTKTSDNTWEVQYTFDGQQQTGVPATTLTFDPSTGKLTSPATPQTIEFQADAAAPTDLTVDYSTCTQYGSEFLVTTNAVNGYISATQNGVQVNDNGEVYVTYSNGEHMLQGQMMLVTFPNENGPEAVSGTTWIQTGESGTPLIGVPGSGTRSTLSSGVLESSNVDITSELVNLTTVQRSYRTNIRVIATSTQLGDALFQAM